VFFAIIERQALRRGDFASVQELVAAIGRFRDGWNQRCQPFAWARTPTRSSPSSSVKTLQRRPTSGVAYDPASNRWRSLPVMQAGRIGHTAVWTGQQLLAWGGQTVRAGSFVAPPHGVAYDPTRNRWSPLPKSPLRGRTGHLAVWTGTQMLIWGGRSIVADPSTANPATFVDGAAYTTTAL
jgi:hypothetical protein